MISSSLASLSYSYRLEPALLPPSPQSIRGFICQLSPSGHINNDNNYNTNDNSLNHNNGNSNYANGFLSPTASELSRIDRINEGRSLPSSTPPGSIKTPNTTPSKKSIRSNTSSNNSNGNHAINDLISTPTHRWMNPRSVNRVSNNDLLDTERVSLQSAASMKLQLSFQPETVLEGKKSKSEIFRHQKSLPLFGVLEEKEEEGSAETVEMEQQNQKREEEEEEQDMQIKKSQPRQVLLNENAVDQAISRSSDGQAEYVAASSSSSSSSSSGRTSSSTPLPLPSSPSTPIQTEIQTQPITPSPKRKNFRQKESLTTPLSSLAETKKGAFPLQPVSFVLESLSKTPVANFESFNLSFSETGSSSEEQGKEQTHMENKSNAFFVPLISVVPEIKISASASSSSSASRSVELAKHLSSRVRVQADDDTLPLLEDFKGTNSSGKYQAEIPSDPHSPLKEVDQISIDHVSPTVSPSPTMKLQLSFATPATISQESNPSIQPIQPVQPYIRSMLPVKNNHSQIQERVERDTEIETAKCKLPYINRAEVLISTQEALSTPIFLHRSSSFSFKNIKPNDSISPPSLRSSSTLIFSDVKTSSASPVGFNSNFFSPLLAAGLRERKVVTLSSLSKLPIPTNSEYQEAQSEIERYKKKSLPSLTDIEKENMGTVNDNNNKTNFNVPSHNQNQQPNGCMKSSAFSHQAVSIPSTLPLRAAVDYEKNEIPVCYSPPPFSSSCVGLSQDTEDPIIYWADRGTFDPIQSLTEHKKVNITLPMAFPFLNSNKNNGITHLSFNFHREEQVKNSTCGSLVTFSAGIGDHVFLRPSGQSLPYIVQIMQLYERHSVRDTAPSPLSSVLFSCSDSSLSVPMYRPQDENCCFLYGRFYYRREEIDHLSSIPYTNEIFLSSSESENALTTIMGKTTVIKVEKSIPLSDINNNFFVRYSYTPPTISRSDKKIKSKEEIITVPAQLTLLSNASVKINVLQSHLAIHHITLQQEPKLRRSLLSLGGDLNDQKSNHMQHEENIGTVEKQQDMMDSLPSSRNHFSEREDALFVEPVLDHGSQADMAQFNFATTGTTTATPPTREKMAQSFISPSASREKLQHSHSALSSSPTLTSTCLHHPSNPTETEVIKVLEAEEEERVVFGEKSSASTSLSTKEECGSKRRKIEVSIKRRPLKRLTRSPSRPYTFPSSTNKQQAKNLGRRVQTMRKKDVSQLPSLADDAIAFPLDGDVLDPAFLFSPTFTSYPLYSQNQRVEVYNSNNGEWYVGTIKQVFSVLQLLHQQDTDLKLKQKRIIGRGILKREDRLDGERHEGLLSVDVDIEEWCYDIHYDGWSSRYDECVSQTIIARNRNSSINTVLEEPEKKSIGLDVFREQKCCDTISGESLAVGTKSDTKSSNMINSLSSSEADTKVNSSFTSFALFVADEEVEVFNFSDNTWHDARIKRGYSTLEQASDAPTNQLTTFKHKRIIGRERSAESNRVEEKEHHLKETQNGNFRLTSPLALKRKRGLTFAPMPAFAAADDETCLTDEWCYDVHYHGWPSRYDECVTQSIIRQKQKQVEVEREEKNDENQQGKEKSVSTYSSSLLPNGQPHSSSSLLSKYSVGDSILVFNDHSNCWFDGTITDCLTRSDLLSRHPHQRILARSGDLSDINTCYHIHYPGTQKKWDEWVTPGLMKKPDLSQNEGSVMKTTEEKSTTGKSVSELVHAQGMVLENEEKDSFISSDTMVPDKVKQIKSPGIQEVEIIHQEETVNPTPEFTLTPTSSSSSNQLGITQPIITPPNTPVILSDLFSAFSFLITGYSCHKHQTTLYQQISTNITQHSGKIFKLISEAAVEKDREKAEESHPADTKQSISLRHLLILAPACLHTAKYYYSLALGLSPLSPHWITDSIHQNKLLIPANYLIVKSANTIKDINNHEKIDNGTQQRSSNKVKNYSNNSSNINNSYSNSPCFISLENLFPPSSFFRSLRSRSYWSPLPLTERILFQGYADSGGLVVKLCGGKKFLNEWKFIIETAGGKLLEEKMSIDNKKNSLLPLNCHLLLVELGFILPSSLYSSARACHAHILSIDWLKASLQRQERMPFNTFLYKHFQGERDKEN